MIRAGLALLSAALLGCASGADRAAPPQSSAPVVAVAAPPSTPAPPTAPPRATTASPSPPVPPACASARARFEQALAAGGACHADADCACYGVLGLQGAIAVTDRKTAAALDAINDAYTKDHCPAACVQTAVPPTCAARCVSGRCK